MALFILPGSAFAEMDASGDPGTPYVAPPPNPMDINTCAPGLPDWQVTTKVVACIENTVEATVITFIDQVTAAVRFPVAALFTLSVIFFGLRIIMGEREVLKTSMSFLLRLLLVMGFAFSMDQFALLPFQIMEQGVALVTGGWSPWVQIDTVMGTLLGFAPGMALFQGIIGIVGAALFSAATGFFLFMFGIMAILSMLLLVYRSVYTFLMAIVLIGFMMAVSPLIVPMAIFGYGERYFRKWLDVIVAAIIQQIMVFAFLWMFLGLLFNFVGQVFNAFGATGDDFSAVWRNNMPYFSWSMTQDPSLFQRMESQGLQRSPPLVQALMNPMLGRSMDLGAINHPAIDFGPNTITTVQNLIGVLLPMALTCYLLRVIIDHIPDLANHVAGGIHIGSAHGPRFMSVLKQAMGSLGGG